MDKCHHENESDTITNEKPQFNGTSVGFSTKCDNCGIVGTLWFEYSDTDWQE